MPMPDCSVNKIVSGITEKWCLGTHGIDASVMRDIESAIFEAYMSGCCSGGMDSDEFNRGLEFFQEIDK